MQRPKQHRIDTDAKRIFSYKIQDDTGFVAREQPGDDYGIDFEVEFFSEEKSTGLIFKVQLKGQEKVKISKDSKFVIFNKFPIKTIEYLLEQVEIPSIIALVDISSENVYWLNIHSNENLIQSYSSAKTKKQKSITLKFPTTNLLPNTKFDLLSALYDARNTIALQRSSQIEEIDYSKYLDNIEDFSFEINHLQSKLEIGKLTQAANLLENRETDLAKKIIDSILSNTDYSADSKFQAILFLEQVFL